MNRILKSQRYWSLNVLIIYLFRYFENKNAVAFYRIVLFKIVSVVEIILSILWDNLQNYTQKNSSNFKR